MNIKGRHKRRNLVLATAMFGACLSSSLGVRNASVANGPAIDWPQYRGDLAGTDVDADHRTCHDQQPCRGVVCTTLG